MLLGWEAGTGQGSDLNARCQEESGKCFVLQYLGWNPGPCGYSKVMDQWVLGMCRYFSDPGCNGALGTRALSCGLASELMPTGISSLLSFGPNEEGCGGGESSCACGCPQTLSRLGGTKSQVIGSWDRTWGQLSARRPLWPVWAALCLSVVLGKGTWGGRRISSGTMGKTLA